jgi:hypothetical protein
MYLCKRFPNLGEIIVGNPRLIPIRSPLSERGKYRNQRWVTDDEGKSTYPNLTLLAANTT